VLTLALCIYLSKAVCRKAVCVPYIVEWSEICLSYPN